MRDTWPDLNESILGDIQLIASELVTNAVQHGQPIIELHLRRAPFAVDVAVLDHGSALPSAHVTQADANDTHSRGLLIVESLSNEWGVEPLEGGGKTVWASLNR